VTGADTGAAGTVHFELGILYATCVLRRSVRGHPLPDAPDDISNAESRYPQVGEFSISSDDASSPATARQILKVLRNPRLAAALFNAPDAEKPRLSCGRRSSTL